MDTDNTNGIALDRKLKREKFSLSDTEGLTITKEDLEKLIFELKNARQWGDRTIQVGDMFYLDFEFFVNEMIKKYFKKV